MQTVTSTLTEPSPPEVSHPNLANLRMHKMLREMGFLTSVYVLFATWRGVDESQFLAIQGIFVLAMLFSDPFISPLADKYGRKPVLFVGSVLWLVGHAFIGFGYGTGTFVGGEIILGLAAACNRSASEALLYDTLIATGRTEEHQTFLSRQWQWASYAAGATMVAGALLFEVSPLIPATLTVLINLALPIIALRMKEVPMAEHEVKPDYRQILAAAWANLASPATRWLVLVPAFITGSTAALFWVIQPVFSGQGVSAWFLGVLAATSLFLRGKIAVLCPHVVARFGMKTCFALCIAAMLGGYLTMAFAPWWVAYPFYVLGTGATYMMCETLGKDLLQRRVRSSFRSASIGGYQAIGRVVSAAVMFGFPVVQSAAGLPLTLVIISAITSMAAALCLSQLR